MMTLDSLIERANESKTDIFTMAYAIARGFDTVQQAEEKEGFHDSFAEWIRSIWVETCDRLGVGYDHNPYSIMQDTEETLIIRINKTQKMTNILRALIDHAETHLPTVKNLTSEKKGE